MGAVVVLVLAGHDCHATFSLLHRLSSTALHDGRAHVHIVILRCLVGCVKAARAPHLDVGTEGYVLATHDCHHASTDCTTAGRTCTS